MSGRIALGITAAIRDGIDESALCEVNDVLDELGVAAPVGEVIGEVLAVFHDFGVRPVMISVED